MVWINLPNRHSYYENKQLISEWETLVNPEVDFCPFNVEIHGIRPIHVKNAPTFLDIHERVRSLLQDIPIACYGHFDRTAFKQACEGDDLQDIEGNWINLHSVVRRTWSDQFANRGYGLDNVCRYLEIPLEKHHNALSDAKAAASVFIAAQTKTNTLSGDWHSLLKQGNSAWVQKYKQKVEDAKANINPNGLLYGEVVVFTGQLSMTRAEAMLKAAQLGCTPANGVTGKTTMLVVGDQDLRKVGNDGMSSKQEKTLELIKKGNPIRIIGESDFQAMVGLIEE